MRITTEHGRIKAGISPYWLVALGKKDADTELIVYNSASDTIFILPRWIVMT